ncbi:hypothetical protein N5E31_03500 [Pseudomonas chengduensis]|uniref:hypothetical protein n=1 Tax=Pseudomonas sediminis TaxID=1691904 RepID=UPI002448F225|nr:MULTISPECIES: hypothetical protein [Pseudomonas]MDG9757827.1 hypothetical protein [Pseudomonas sediminis]MDH0622967.1 hypothetical protein [Pseudomonas chengduensis]MDH1664538.1 hypothetical protein [Pseudomonas chengduensis]
MSRTVLHRHGRRLGLALLWTLLLLVVTIAANVIGIHLAGGIEGWQQWLTAHTNHFLAWRLLLYAGTAWGWLWVRRRVLAREPGTRQRLLRAEIAAVVAVMALEISQMTGD